MRPVWALGYLVLLGFAFSSSRRRDPGSVVMEHFCLRSALLGRPVPDELRQGRRRTRIDFASAFNRKRQGTLWHSKKVIGGTSRFLRLSRHSSLAFLLSRRLRHFIAQHLSLTNSLSGNRLTSIGASVPFPYLVPFRAVLFDSFEYLVGCGRRTNPTRKCICSFFLNGTELFHGQN